MKTPHQHFRDGATHHARDRLAARRTATAAKIGMSEFLMPEIRRMTGPSGDFFARIIRASAHLDCARSSQSANRACDFQKRRSKLQRCRILAFVNSSYLDPDGGDSSTPATDQSSIRRPKGQPSITQPKRAAPWLSPKGWRSKTNGRTDLRIHLQKPLPKLAPGAALAE